MKFRDVLDKTYNVFQVYWFGTQSIYLDRNIVYVLDTQSFSWRPVGMEELLQLAGIS